MKFLRTTLKDVWLIELQLREDERGCLARTYCEEEFAAQGLNTRWPQCNLTWTNRRGVIRGMHYQAEPRAEIKLVRCTVGGIFDVVADIRRHSPTYGRWEAFKLNQENRLTLYVPAGFAHGFQCLVDRSEVCYQMSEPYVPELAGGVRWNDPTLGIQWPIANPTLSPRDQNLPWFSLAP